MLKKLYEDFYMDENGRFCIIAETVDNPDAIARKTGLDKWIGKNETIVRIGRNIVKSFKRIELEQRLGLYFDPSEYDIPDAIIPYANGSYFIVAEPIEEEFNIDGIPHRVEEGKLAVKFVKLYRSNIVQNEINRALKKALLEKRDFYQSPESRRFLYFILAELR
ncbi:MAG: hypothetical protein AABX54_00335 [Nanoarchaeota archaeon]